ncbi:flagellar basal body P-ring formation chaperone FlgA [Planctomycetota bacterium]
MRKILLALVLAFLSIQVSVGAGVDIELRKQSVVRQATVYLRDIATISGGDAVLRNRCGEVDVALLAIVSDDESIGKSLVEIRLLIAGLDGTDFNISGAESVTVRRIKNRSMDESIIETAQSALATIWQVKAEDVFVQLANPLSDTLLARLGSNSEIKPILTGEPRLGTNRILFGAYENGTLIEKFTASLEVSIQKELAIAKVPLKAGMIIEKEHVDKVRRNFRSRDALHSPSDVVGLEVSRTIRPGQIITSSVIRPADVSKKRDIIVKRRTRVRLVATKGRVTVSIPEAEALDDGAVGETIRVRNLQSGKIVTGRIASDKSVKISL